MSKYTDAIRELAKKKAIDAAKVETLLNAHANEQDGGPGSGNFGHAGRPGKRGGSSPKGGASGGQSKSGGASIASTSASFYSPKKTGGSSGKSGYTVSIKEPRHEEVGRGSAAGRAMRQNRLVQAGVRKYGDYWIAKNPETLKDPQIQAMIKAENGGKMPNVGHIYYSNGMPEDLDNGFKVGGPSPSAFKLDKKAKEAVQTFMNNGGLEKLGRKVDNKVKEFEKGGGLTGLAKKADQKINSFLKQGGTSKYGERADKAIQTFLQNGGVMNIEGPSETETSELSPEAAKSRKAIQDQFKAARAFLRKEMQNFHRGSEDMKHFHDALEDMKKPLGTRPSPEESEAYSKEFASNISSKMDDYTKKKYLKAIEDEPKITKDMCDIAESMGYGFFGLNYRLKSGGDNEEGVCRLMQKRQEYLDEALAKKKPITPEEATDKLKDMVRYTLCVSQDTMGDDADKVLGELEKKNYKIIKIGSTWTEQRGDNPYRGLNCAVVSPDGTTFELQFHSPESYATKNALHGRYKIARGEKSTKKKKKEANGVMRHYYNALRTPKGLEKLQPRIDRLG